MSRIKEGEIIPVLFERAGRFDEAVVDRQIGPDEYIVYTIDVHEIHGMLANHFRVKAKKVLVVQGIK